MPGWDEQTLTERLRGEAAVIGDDPGRVERVLAAAEARLRRRRTALRVGIAVPAVGGIAVAVVLVPARPHRPVPPSVASSSPTPRSTPVGPELTVTCTRDGVVVPDRQVPVQRDGIHVRLVNTTAEEVTDLSLTPDSSRGVGSITLDSYETRRYVREDAPGWFTAACGTSRVRVEVIDPRRIYHPAQLRCPGGETMVTTSDPVPGQAGKDGDPIALQQAEDPDAEISYAYYPASPARHVAIRRHGELVAVQTWERLPAGGWFATTLQACPVNP